MSYHQSGQLPHHQYCYVDAAAISSGEGFIPCVWFGLVSIPGRMWGCTVMLECGAVYRSIPPHFMAFNDKPEAIWTQQQAQRWDCYGREFSTIEYTYLRGVECSAKCDDQKLSGEYIFTAAPIDDGFSRHPSQAKEFMFIKLYNGRLTIQPTDKVLFLEKSFVEPQWPSDLKLSDEVWSCE